MAGFRIATPDEQIIRFRLYEDTAPHSAAAFLAELPFTTLFFHARVSGQEIWAEDVPKLDVPQENSSVFPAPGEIAIGPINPTRNKVAGLAGIFYGDGKLIDGANIFGIVYDEDLPLLVQLGERIWKEGAMQLKFEKQPG